MYTNREIAYRFNGPSLDAILFQFDENISKRWEEFNKRNHRLISMPQIAAIRDFIM